MRKLISFLVCIAVALSVSPVSYSQEENIPVETSVKTPIEMIQPKENIQPENSSTVVIPEEKVQKDFPSHSLTLKDLIKQAEENLKKIAKEMNGRENERISREHFEKGNALYKEGNWEEAKREWEKTIGITKDPEMREYIKKIEKRDHAARLKREQQERRRKLEEERKKREIKRKKQAEEAAKRKSEKKAKIETRKLERAKELAEKNVIKEISLKRAAEEKARKKAKKLARKREREKKRRKKQYEKHKAAIMKIKVETAEKEKNVMN